MIPEVALIAPLAWIETTIVAASVAACPPGGCPSVRMMRLGFTSHLNYRSHYAHAYFSARGQRIRCSINRCGRNLGSSGTYMLANNLRCCVDGR